MEVKILREAGYEQAIIGLSLSYDQIPEDMPRVAKKLCFRGDGHNKFIESIMIWIDIVAPRYWWQQFDTYRIGVTKQSQSTMHTITKRELEQGDFEHPVAPEVLEMLNRSIREEDWECIKYNLPESFLQRRIVCLNYMSLQRIIRQRESHRLREWQEFISVVIEQIDHPELLKE